MSSILEALKKLEKEKLHRDEISTAIASDILKSGRKKKTTAWHIPLALFLFVVAGGSAAMYLLSIQSAPDADIKQPPIIVPSQEQTRPSTPMPRAEVATQSVQPPDLPLLSGIVFQQQAEARMAIINDLPVMEGTVIAGYTLQQILPDHVVLVRDKQSFSLFLPGSR